MIEIYKKVFVVICVYVLQIMEISEAVELISGKIAAALQDSFGNKSRVH